MKENTRLQGFITALVTPMYPDGQIDFDSLTNLIEFQIKHKVDALVAIGSTGEAATLTHVERISVVEHVIKITKQRTKIIVGIGDIATNFAVEFTKTLNAIDGIDYYMATTPAYVRPTQEGLYQHFKAISLASKRQIILYNIPGRTGCDLANKTALQLAEDCVNIVGLKDATANIARACDLFLHRQPKLSVYSGDDATALAFVLSGGDGVISAVSNVAPEQFGIVIKNALAGNKALAIEANDKLQALHDVLFIESNPIPVKWALSFMGIIRHDSVRLPLVPLTDNAQEKVRAVIGNLK